MVPGVGVLVEDIPRGPLQPLVSPDGMGMSDVARRTGGQETMHELHWRYPTLWGGQGFTLSN